MDILATRRLHHVDDNGNEDGILLTIFVPFEEREGLWKCGFIFTPPISPNVVHGAGVDFIHAFLGGLRVARIFLESTKLFGQANWHGMLDCGLPARAEAPALLSSVAIPPLEVNPGTLAILTTRSLGYPDEGGVESEIILTIFVPFKVKDDIWKCGFTFGSPATAPVHYGTGADFIEALLDGLAEARRAFEGMVPKSWISAHERLDCADLPYKIGRSFWTDMGSKPAAD